MKPALIILLVIIILIVLWMIFNCKLRCGSYDGFDIMPTPRRGRISGGEFMEPGECNARQHFNPYMQTCDPLFEDIVPASVVEREFPRLRNKMTPTLAIPGSTRKEFGTGVSDPLDLPLKSLGLWNW